MYMWVPVPHDRPGYIKDSGKVVNSSRASIYSSCYEVPAVVRCSLHAIPCIRRVH